MDDDENIDLMRALLKQYSMDCLKKREALLSDIVAGFMARYRLDPAECVLVESNDADGTRWWLERKGPNDRYEGTVSPVQGEW